MSTECSRDYSRSLPTVRIKAWTYKAMQCSLWMFQHDAYFTSSCCSPGLLFYLLPSPSSLWTKQSVFEIDPGTKKRQWTAEFKFWIWNPWIRLFCLLNHPVVLKKTTSGRRAGIWEEELGKGANRWSFSQRQYQRLEPAPCIYQRITPFSGKFRFSFLSPNGEIEQ